MENLATSFRQELVKRSIQNCKDIDQLKDIATELLKSYIALQNMCKAQIMKELFPNGID